jgi:branched-chain amino acid transport system permease protein
MEKTNKKSLIYALAAILGLLLFVSILENLCLWLPAASLPKFLKPTSMLFTVLKKGAVYSLIAVSLNLLNGFTGLFSLGHAGFMLLGAYTYAIFCTDTGVKDSIFYKYGGTSVNFSFVEMYEKLFGENMLSMSLGVITAMIMAGLVAALVAFLIGLPVLRLKSDYLAIATLGFAEIVRALFQWEAPFWGKITNGANMIKGFPKFTDFNIKGANGQVVYYMSTLVPFLFAGICIAIMVLIIRSTHGRAFKAIRDDEIAAEAMGIGLAKHKMLSFCTSAFFAGIGGVMYAMYTTTVQAKPFTSALTYEILLIVVIGGIGSVSGSCLASFLFIACSEWWLRFLDKETMIGSFKVPLLRDGFRMVVFSAVIMIIVLFFRRGIMGDKELPDVVRGIGKKLSQKKIKKEGAADENRTEA